MKSSTRKVKPSGTPESSELPTTTAPAHSSLEALAAQIKETLGVAWVPRFYCERILPLRTRAHALQPAAPKPEQVVEVQHTLLGVELKIGRRRLSCPDLATARYLATFARAGCTDVAVPYDISQISRLADELESSWQRMLLLIEHLANKRNKAYRTRLRTALIADVQQEVTAAGAGAAIPQFNQNTTQRQRRV